MAGVVIARAKPNHHPVAWALLQATGTRSAEDFTALVNVYQDGDTLVGTLKLPTGDVRVDGKIDGVKASGVWNQTGGTSNSFTWYLLNATQFNGNYNGDKKWCGYRTGSSAPATCLAP